MKKVYTFFLKLFLIQEYTGPVALYSLFFFNKNYFVFENSMNVEKLVYLLDISKEKEIVFL